MSHILFWLRDQMYPKEFNNIPTSVSPVCPWRKKKKSNSASTIVCVHYIPLSSFWLVGSRGELAEFLGPQMETYRVICISQEQEGQYQKKRLSTIHLNKSRDLLWRHSPPPLLAFLVNTYCGRIQAEKVQVKKRKREVRFFEPAFSCRATCGYEFSGKCISRYVLAGKSQSKYLHLYELMRIYLGICWQKNTHVSTYSEIH